ncbi:exodeoxyribonuclease V subunit gamma [Chlamydiifrater phoenicopteri]|uniref:exodeoxyribonuclease V subunit gamma n=1 Tax=Chlamydiifrater phoenicopteri TaxID=2681469 RepID=UPI001BCD7F27|nr:exodeoxyribonuclease V subunit gamma [Chlamydiifrater phoenicopteri]
MSHKENNVFFSNSLHHLLAKLSIDLFSTKQTPFSRRRILVPTIEICNWVQNELLSASPNHTVLGSRFLTSPEAFIKFLYTEFCQKNSEFPDFPTLPLWLHEKIRENTENPIFTDFFQQLKSKIPFNFTLSLAQAFRKYYLNHQPIGGANNYYQLFFEKVCSHFVSPTNIMQEIRTQGRLKDSNLSLFVFTLSGLPLHMLSFLSEISAQIPVYFYVLLPTKEYFGDMISDNFIDKYLERHIEKASTKALSSWENYVFSNRNSLLANLSFSCRSALNFFVDKNFSSTEHFFPPKEDSSFELLKSDIFQLKESSKKEFSQKASSITISKAPSLVREVQAVFCKISTLILSGTSLKDIRILCKKIKDYAPIIRSIFSPHIPLSIRGVISSSGERLQNKIRIISSLILSRGSLPNLHKLFSHPDMRRVDYKEDLETQLSTIDKIFYQIPISERKKGSHLNSLADAIIDNYPFSETTGKAVCPELLGEMALTLYRLHSLVEENLLEKEASIQDFTEKIFSLMEDIFLLENEEQFLVDKLKKNLASYKDLSCSLFFFFDFCLHFVECFHQEPALHQGKLLVGPIQTLASIPSTHTFVLGASSSQTSKEEDSFSLDLIKLDEDSNNNDDKNSLFLEIITSTKESLHISFSSSGECPEAPLPAVEWIAEASHTPMQTIPTQPFSKENFKERLPLHSSMTYHFELAKAFYSPRKQADIFINYDPPVSYPQEEKIISLSIADIVSTLQNPLNAFLTKKAKFSPSIFSTITSPLLYTTSYKDLLKIWTNYIRGNTENASLSHKYISERLRSELTSQSKHLVSFLQKLQAAKQSALSSVRFSSSLFQENFQGRNAPEFEILWNEYKIKLRGTIHGVSASGLSILSPAMSSGYKKAFPLSIFSENHPYLHHRIEAKLYMALLSLTKMISPDAKVIQEVFCLPNEIFTENHSQQNLDPGEYLRTVLKTYFAVLEVPFPLFRTLDQVHQMKWLSMSKGDWNKFCCSTNQPKDFSPSFWVTQNRALSSEEFEERTRDIFDLYTKLL